MAQHFSSAVKDFIVDSAETTALVDATLFDGTGGPVKTHQTVIISSGLISQVGRTEDIHPPAGANIVNCAGKTLIPGLVMLHEHFYYTILLDQLFNVQEMPFSFPRMYLAGGATTIRTAGCIEPQTDLAIQRMINQGTMIGPDVDVTAPYIERKGWDIPSMFLIRDSAEAATMAAFWADRGCTSFKMYTHATVEDLMATSRVAHKRGLKVTGHLGTITYREAAEAGIDDLEHGFFASSDFDHQRKNHEFNEPREFQALIDLDVNSPEMKSLIQLLVSKHVALTSTLPVFGQYLNEELILGAGEKALIPSALDSVKSRLNRRQKNVSGVARLFNKDIAWEKQFFDAGGLLVAGTDPTGSGGVLPGYGTRTEIEYLVKGGFSITQAIQVCTLNGARYLGKEKLIGSIEPGKRADIVVLNGSLETDIHNIRNTEIVFKQGVGYDSRKIFESVNGHVGMN
jgi:imidazolonepropionase-like amidohydrolase